MRRRKRPVYFGIVEVLLGSGNYEEKIQQVPPILEKLAELYPDTAGTLHLENYDPESESIRFRCRQPSIFSAIKRHLPIV